MLLCRKALPLQSTDDRTRGIRIIASSLYRELVSQGYSASHIIDLTSELLSLLMGSMRSTEKEASGCMVATLCQPRRKTT